MTGQLNLTTPWARQYFAEEHRAIVEDLIPHGHTLYVGARRKPGEWTLRLFAPWTAEDVAERRTPKMLHEATVYTRDLAFACIETLRRWARQDEQYTVTVDLEGTPTLHGWEKN